jgi:hypothetical protein
MENIKERSENWYRNAPLKEPITYLEAFGADV